MSIQEFDSLLLNNTEFLKPFAINLTKDTEKAKNLCQETLCRALSNRDKYQVGTNIRAWLSVIMRNTFVNEYRREKLRKRVFIENKTDFYSDFQYKKVTSDAEDRIGTREIKKSIKGLPEIFRIPFLMYFEGYRYDEIAKALGEPLGTIKSRIHFARKLLKAELKPV
jgi:RNA polymerase sigma-70 factor (ECF subfamily)